MMTVPPKEIAHKIRWDKEKVLLCDGVVLTPKEKKLFEQYKNAWKRSYEDKFK